MRLYCHCLNITLDVLGKSDDQESLTQMVPADLIQLVNGSHEWIVYDVSGSPTMNIAWPNLLQSIPARDLKIHRCYGCNLYTHVSDVTPSQILVNKHLFNETTVKSVYSNPNYSETLKIVLSDTLNSPTTGRVLNSQDESVQYECERAQKLFRQTLGEAEQEKDEKIRLYQREQEQIFENKAAAMTKERDAFLRLLRSLPSQSVTVRTSPTLPTSASFFNENSTESGFGSDICDVGPSEFYRQPSTIERTYSERSPDMDEDTNDDPLLENSSNWLLDNTSAVNFATSLPKTIALRPSSNTAIPQSNDENMNDLDRIGKSFREMSRSMMCTDGTELFGDLPSPRLNSRPT